MHKVFGLFLVSIYYKTVLFLTFWMFVYVNIYINIYKRYVKPFYVNLARCGWWVIRFITYKNETTAKVSCKHGL